MGSSENLYLVEEIRARGLSEADIDALGAREPVDVAGLDAYWQGLAERSTGMENPHLDPKVRKKPEYEIGTRVIDLVRIGEEGKAA